MLILGFWTLTKVKTCRNNGVTNLYPRRCFLKLVLALSYIRYLLTFSVLFLLCRFTVQEHLNQSYGLRKLGRQWAICWLKKNYALRLTFSASVWCMQDFMKPHNILAHSDNFYTQEKKCLLNVFWMSWNFVRFHKILNKTDAENYKFLSWQTKKFYSKKNMTCHDSSDLNRKIVSQLSYYIWHWFEHSYF